VAPAPGVLSAQIRPPWRATMRCTVASPMPVPAGADPDRERAAVPGLALDFDDAAVSCSELRDSPITGQADSQQTLKS
jgi:hypothetical protein